VRLTAREGDEVASGGDDRSVAFHEKTRITSLLHCLPIWMLTLFGAVGLVVPAESAPIISYDVSFSDYGGGSPSDWLASKGFEIKRRAGEVSFIPVGDILVVETSEKAAGLLVSEVNVSSYSKIRITWGVDVFPPGASYVKGVRSEAIMVYVFFGTKRLPSGSSIVPDMPYFIGLSLCETDPVGESFKGRYFRTGGRYVCIDRAHRGQAVITEYPIADAFRRLFGQSQAPAITGVGVAIDTESAKGNGVAKSFISKIEVLK
jgi:hypothetical protein